MNLNLTPSIKKLASYIQDSNFEGFDPYDTLNSFIPFHWGGKWGQVLAIQFQKRNPVNIRPLIGIKKFHSTKGMGLLLLAYINLYKLEANDVIRGHIEFIKNWLLCNQQRYEGNGCWGYDYNYATRRSTVKKGHPTIIHHSYIQRALFSYWQLFKDKKVEDVLLESKNFVLNALQRIKDGQELCFTYNPTATGCCYNANMHAAECLARVYFISKDEVLKTHAINAVNFVVKYQKKEGFWNYSAKYPSGPEETQIDFHQGFILDSFDEVSKYLNYTCMSWQKAIDKGLDYYYNVQFNKNGSSLWRVPRVFPIDIHNQAQGILTFSRFSKNCTKYKEFADKIADWTIKNMQDTKKGYFYYRKYRNYYNRIPYMRWSQAWMLLALSELLLKNQDDD